RIVSDKTRGLCVYCGEPIYQNWKMYWNFPLDHFVPVSKDRNDHVDNLYLSCRICNEMKGFKSYPSIRQAQEAIQKERTKYHQNWMVDRRIERYKRKEYY